MFCTLSRCAENREITSLFEFHAVKMVQNCGHMRAILKSLIVWDLCISYIPLLQYYSCSELTRLQDINAFDITPSSVNNKALKKMCD